MVLICTLDGKLERALRISVGRKALTMPAEDVRPDLSYRERCVRAVGALLPSAVFLDVRAGQSGLRAVDVIPWMLRASPLTAIVVLTLRPTDEEVAEVEALGAYSFIDLARRDLPDQIRRAVAAFESARPAARAPQRPRRRRQLH